MTGGPADSPELQEAAAALRRGEVVVFPTETVYGLGANALDAAAVARVFAVKGRPPDNPLIVHVADVAGARGLVREWTPLADRLAAAFWPGPLTLVLDRAAHVPGVTTAGLDSIALRSPANAVAQALLRASGVPLAAPSANTSGRPSPTRVEHARADLGDRVACYLDGGPTALGIESTVIDLRTDPPRLLRPGSLPREQVEAVTGPLDAPDAGDPVRSPGLRHRHYAPRARVEVLPRAQMPLRFAELAATSRVGAIVSTPLDGVLAVIMGTDASEWARRLFAVLRDLEDRDVILVEEPPAGGLGEAVRDRLRRAQAR
jgi:L-threonylcarbamoyladenylate synthase